MVGGTPQYLLQLNDKLSIEENIKNIFLNPNSSLFEEPENLLKQEVREASLYNAIITAIATGSSRLSEISSKVGEDSNVCASYLKNLLALGIVKRETPYGEKISRKSIYAISDNMFRFWYRFIPANISLISRGAQELAYKRIEPFLADYMGRVFEDICQQYLWQLYSTIMRQSTLPTLGVGGVRINNYTNKQKLILWQSKTRILHFLANVNGQMRK